MAQSDRSLDTRAGAGLTALLVLACCGTAAERNGPRADLLRLEVAGATLQRPPVPFPHDLHTRRLATEGKGCEECHPADAAGHHSIAFQRPSGEALDAGAAQRLYHDACIGCHQSRPGAPVACGGCHLKSSPAGARLPMAFDHSLHTIHIKAASEAPGRPETSCKACHHVRDEATRKLVWAKGQEASCRDCHPPQGAPGTTPLRAAVHAECVGCHLARRAARGAQVKAGPLECAGCHGAEAQARFPRLAKIPRLDRGQPDVRYLAPPQDETALAAMRSVPFDHGAIEATTPTCRACHHEKLKACRECHRLRAAKEGETVALSTAMHAPDSGRSCVGCHDRIKRDPSCAGCHGLIPLRHSDERQCGRCHAGPMPGSERPGAEHPEALLEAMRAPQAVSFARESIPDQRKLGTIAEQYLPAGFPHARMIASLTERAAASRVAMHFHGGGGDALCLGCHHEAARGVLPVACSSCHRREGTPGDLGHRQVPALKAAYHLQCIGCHTRMTKGPTDCTGCHAKT